MIRVPPGRAGQVWLRRRRATAARGVDILTRKQHLLVEERAHRSPHADAARAAWTNACADAERWCSRALRLAHQAQIPLVAAQLQTAASVDVEWRNVMAVAIPISATCRLPDGTMPSGSGGSAATDQAVAALGVAVEKALEHAAIQRALANIDAELLQTRRRLRLLERRRLPQLDAALAASGERLEQNEREDILRLRWARGR
ncbi:MAG: V-type ATP synthase subunit D [Candidatus Dormiibacterota bacterium]